MKIFAALFCQGGFFAFFGLLKYLRPFCPGVQGDKSSFLVVRA